MAKAVSGSLGVTYLSRGLGTNTQNLSDAFMVELVDTIALGAIAQYGRAGASPAKCTLIT